MHSFLHNDNIQVIKLISHIQIKLIYNHVLPELILHSDYSVLIDCILNAIDDCLYCRRTNDNIKGRGH